MQDSTLLTTVDNPYNPFTHWQEWYNYDVENGYHTCSLLARLTQDVDYIDTGLTKAVMQEIVTVNVTGKHVLVNRRTAIDVASSASK